MRVEKVYKSSLITHASSTAAPSLALFISTVTSCPLLDPRPWHGQAHAQLRDTSISAMLGGSTYISRLQSRLVLPRYPAHSVARVLLFSTLLQVISRFGRKFRCSYTLRPIDISQIVSLSAASLGLTYLVPTGSKCPCPPSSLTYLELRNAPSFQSPAFPHSKFADTNK